MLDSRMFKYEKGYWYPHMKPRDIEIWERFIDKFPDMYQECQYDIEVGDIPEYIKNSTDEAEQRQASLYRLKIDVVGHVPNRVDLLEIKPDADPRTIGQIEGYKALYIRDEKPNKPISLAIVTNIERPNMRFLCEQKGIKLFVV